MRITSRIPLASVIITTKNEQSNIGNCLESIKQQTYPQEEIETIVVDNNSTDKTKEIARKYTRKVYNKGPERSAQRNYGMIRKAKGKYVMYLDADMILSRTVIEEAINLLTDSKINGLKDTNRSKLAETKELVALYIPEVVLGNSFWSRVRRFERSFYDGTLIDCARIIRKDAFKKVGGFDASLTGPEDWDLDKKLREIGKVELLGGYDFEKINKALMARIIPSRRHAEFSSASPASGRLLSLIYHPLKILNFPILSGNQDDEGASRLSVGKNQDDEKEQANNVDNADRGVVRQLASLTDEAVIFHNEVEFNLRKYLKKKAYYSQSFSDYIKKWGKDDPDIKRQLGFWYRYFGVFLENGKWKRLLRHPILTTGMFFLRFLVGLQYLKGRIHEGGRKH